MKSGPTRRGDDGQGEGILRRVEAQRSVLESVVNQMPAGVLVAKVPSGRVLLCNRRIHEIWGRPLRHEAVSDYATWGGRDEAGRPLEAERWPLACSVLEAKTVRDEEITVARPDGEHRIVRMSASPVRDSGGRQVAAVATVFDVTEARRRERRQQDLERATRGLNASIELGATLGAVVAVVVGPVADWAVLYRHDSGALRAVAAAHRDAGMESEVCLFRDRALPGGREHLADEVAAHRQPRVLHGADRAAAALSGGDPELRDAARRLGCDSVLMLPLVSRDRDLGVLAAVRAGNRYAESDVAFMAELGVRAALAVDNAILYEQARAADKAKAELLAIVSHEVRTPLSAILGFAEILATRVDGDLTPAQQGHLDRVKASVRDLSRLVDEVLAYASMESGRGRVVAEALDLREVVEHAVELMEPMAEAADLKLKVALPAQDVEVETDASKVRQIVINLLSNGVKYTSVGEVRIGLDDGRDSIRCWVQDTGPGISAKHAEHIFEPFWQAEREDSKVSGTGLGLAISRQLARALGGDLTLERLAGGSRFVLVLPRTRPRVADDPTAC